MCNHLTTSPQLNLPVPPQLTETNYSFCVAVCAAFVMSFSDLSKTASGSGRGIIVFSNVHVLDNLDWIRQFPFMVLVAALGGFLGAFFNLLRRVLWKIRASRSRKVLFG